MKKIRVLLAEDHTIVRKGLRSLLEREATIEVVGEAQDGREAVVRVQQLRPDVVILDITMPELNGLEATHQIKRSNPEVNVLILSVHGSEEYVFQALSAGASGYLVKKAAPDELVTAIQAVYRGEPFISPFISGRILQDQVRRTKITPEEFRVYEKLTHREKEILQLVAEGRSNREIAGLLFLSIKTVQTHRANLMDKLGIRSTAELTQYAMRRGLIDPEL